MRTALRVITVLDPDVKRTYKMERRFELLTARLRGKPKDFTIWNHEVLSGGQKIPVRLFSPNSGEKFPLLIFFHGGGWVTGGIESYASVCASLAKAVNCIVASVGYRLAPEYKFPAAVEDCYAVTREYFCGMDFDPDDITLIGDSAGGNLAAVVSLMARDRGEFLPKRQILLYPATYNDHSGQSPFASIRDNGTGYLLTSKRINRAVELYQRSDDDVNNPYFAPLLASDFSHQPRTLIITAEYCPLRDEGEAYGRKLREAGNETEVVCIPDAIHAYMTLPLRSTDVQKTHQIINVFLQGE
jgi:acetyl esterase/lipase